MVMLELSPDVPQALLATVAVRATAIIAAAWLLARALRDAAAATRHAVWSVALASLILLPAVSLILPRWEMPVPAPAAETSAMPMADLLASGGTPLAQGPLGHQHEAMTRSAPAARRGAVLPALLAVLAWVLGVVFGVGRLSAGWAAARRLVGRATPMPGDAEGAVRELSARLGIARPVRVLLSDALTVPVNCGLFRPVILLPAAACDWTDDRLRVVLLHELAHVRRWDYASLLATEAARAMYWMNPLVWMAARSANVELERACDDEVIRAGTRSVEYAEHLYEIAASLAGIRAPRGALAMAQPSTLRARVGAILAGRMNRSPIGFRAVAGATTVALLVGVPLSSLRLLGEGRDAAELKSAISALTMPDAEARQRAAFALGARKSSQARDALIDRLGDADPAVRGMAAWAVGAIGGRAARPALVAALSDPDASVREMAVLALGTLKDPAAVAPLATMTRDPVMGVRGVLTAALKEIGGASAGEVLGDLLLHDREEHVRDMAAWNLRFTLGSNALPWLVRALHDSIPGVRGAAARNLAEIADPRSFDELAEAARHDASPQVRSAASWALGSLKDARAAEPLAAAIRDTVWNVRVAAAAALGDTPGPRALDLLMAATRDPIHQVRLTAVEALGDRAHQ